MKKIVVIDGQGGRLGALLCEAIKKESFDAEVYGVGTNSVATAAMLKAGADYGATGENPVVVACRDADVVIGPVGIVCADALLGEITPQMAHAIGSAGAEKLLVPVNRCGIRVVGARQIGMADAVSESIALLKSILRD